MRRISVYLLVVTTVVLGGCAAKHYDDPIGRMTDRTEGHVVRWAAARQAERDMPDSPKRLAALREMVWQRGHPTQFRTYAVDQLLAHDQADARGFLARRLPIIQDWDTYRHIADLAVENDWREFTPALVRRYAIRTGYYRDADRPEREGLAALNPGEEVEDVIFRVFADANDDMPVTARAAAWQLLCRLVDREALIGRVKAMEPTHSLIADLQAAGRDLHVTADNMVTLAWLQSLATEPYADFRRRAARAVGRLDDPQRIGLELRHLPLIVRLAETNDPMLGESRQQLLSDVEHFIDTQRHHYRGPNFDGPMEKHPQRLHHWRETLPWADAATLKFLTQLMRDRRVVDQFFAQADEDHHDTSTEYGGLVIDDGGTVRAKLYKPMMRRHDRAYYAPRELIAEAYTALAHYHFHAHERRNSAYAGAGMGDMKRIGNTQQFSAIVLTSIDEDTLNVDFYRRDDVVIDLGEIHR